MHFDTLTLTYEYSPYQSQTGEEIPAFEIFNEEGDKVADTNEHQPVEEQEVLAQLFTTAPELLKTLQAARCPNWVHNISHTDDIEALRRICQHYSTWWNEQALPLITQTTGKEMIS